MKITLFIPCFIDAIYPDVGEAVVTVLERLGHEIAVPEKFTCCGQPAFNSGYWDEAREVAVKALECFADAEVVVSPSGSCGAMVKNFYPELFHGTRHEAAACELAAKVWEFSDFLVTKLGVTDVGAKLAGKATFHDGCHGLRELGIKEQPRKLLANVEGLELVEMSPAEVCCGFGGTFSAKYPDISTAMGQSKCDSVMATGVDYLISNDSSCLMHIGGMLKRKKCSIKPMHLAQVLAAC